MATKTIYVCDECGKEKGHESKSIYGNQLPPGWTLIYNLTCKVKFSGAIENPSKAVGCGVGNEKDQTLVCSKECVKKTVKTFIEKEMTMIIDYIYKLK